MTIKYKAPAVHQAIEVIELLNQCNSQSLAEIAAHTGFSKATLLRLLETMEAHCWVAKNPDGAYESLIFINHKNDFSDRSGRLIQNILDELCEQCGYTVEWYCLREEYAEITLRSEPRNRMVNIRAQLGYRRIYASELEAVTRIAMASGMVDCRRHEPKGGYKIYKSGKQTQIPLTETVELISQAQKTLITNDKEWNNHGFRRHAAGVKDSSGKLVGILALATSFTLDADENIDMLNRELKHSAQKLEKLLAR